MMYVASFDPDAIMDDVDGTYDGLEAIYGGRRDVLIRTGENPEEPEEKDQPSYIARLPEFLRLTGEQAETARGARERGVGIRVHYHGSGAYGGVMSEVEAVDAPRIKRR